MSSVKFIGPTKTLTTDLEPYIVNPDLVPKRVEISAEPIQEAVERLFEIPQHRSFSSFCPPDVSPKNIFKEGLLPALDIDAAIKSLDTFFKEHGDQQEEILLPLLFKITDLDNLLKEIRNRMQSILPG